MTEINIELILIFIGMIVSPIYAIQLYTLKKLNFTCNIVSKLAVISRLAHPELAKKVFGDSKDTDF